MSARARLDGQFAQSVQAALPPTNPKRILIILNGAIGDVVRALPLLGRIRRGFPDAHIAWAIEPKSAPILERHPWLDETILYDRRHAPWTFAPFLKRVRDGRFDLAIDLQRHLKSGIISIVSGASDRIGFSAAKHQGTESFVLDAPNRAAAGDAVKAASVSGLRRCARSAVRSDRVRACQLRATSASARRIFSARLLGRASA